MLILFISTPTTRTSLITMLLVPSATRSSEDIPMDTSSTTPIMPQETSAETPPAASSATTTSSPVDSQEPTAESALGKLTI